jgi:hypothetical protein
MKLYDMERKTLTWSLGQLNQFVYPSLRENNFYCNNVWEFLDKWKAKNDQRSHWKMIFSYFSIYPAYGRYRFASNLWPITKKIQSLESQRNRKKNLSIDMEKWFFGQKTRLTFFWHYLIFQPILNLLIFEQFWGLESCDYRSGQFFRGCLDTSKMRWSGRILFREFH